MTAVFVIVAILLVVVFVSRALKPVEATVPTDVNPRDIAAMAREGHKIAAIKAYREQHGVGLREAKEAVERIAAGEAPPPARQADSPFASLNADTAATLHTGQEASMEQIRALIRSKSMIQAIKLYRELHGCGLKEAKDAVERISQGM